VPSRSPWRDGTGDEREGSLAGGYRLSRVDEGLNGHGGVDDSLLDTVDLGTDPFLAVLPRRSPYTESGRVTLREVEQMGLIGEHHGSAQRYIDDALHQHGIAPRYVYRTNDNGAMRAMVRSGLGAAMMPQLAIASHDPDVVILPTTPAIAPRFIVLALPRKPLRTPAAEWFVEIAREVCAERLGPARGSG